MTPSRPVPDQAGPGQESVWAYPRPPRLEPSGKLVEIFDGERRLASTTQAFRVLETSHPPTWYLPPTAFLPGVLRASAAQGTVCEWKGAATYWNVATGTRSLPAEAWSYPRPNPRFSAITDYVAVYARSLACFVDGERVRPQPGGFYGGWVTDDIVGPFKGVPDSRGW